MYHTAFDLCSSIYIQGILVPNFGSFDASDSGSWELNCNFPSAGRKLFEATGQDVPMGEAEVRRRGS